MWNADLTTATVGESSRYCFPLGGKNLFYIYTRKPDAKIMTSVVEQMS